MWLRSIYEAASTGGAILPTSDPQSLSQKAPLPNFCYGFV